MVTYEYTQTVSTVCSVTRTAVYSSILFLNINRNVRGLKKNVIVTATIQCSYTPLEITNNSHSVSTALFVFYQAYTAYGNYLCPHKWVICCFFLHVVPSVSVSACTLLEHNNEKRLRETRNRGQEHYETCLPHDRHMERCVIKINNDSWVYKFRNIAKRPKP